MGLFQEIALLIGFIPDSESLDNLFIEFKKLADNKKNVEPREIEALIRGNLLRIPETWKLDQWAVNTGSALGASGTVRLQHRDGLIRKEVSMGDGPVDSLFKAINKIIKKEPLLELYEIGAVSGGSSSQGETSVKILWDGRRWNGRGVSTDIVESSIKAYLAAINALEYGISEKNNERRKNEN